MNQPETCPSCNGRFPAGEAAVDGRCRACATSADGPGTAPAGACHDVFISYSSKDYGPADAVLRAVEGAGIRCWIAPRDIRPGADWGAAIIDAIGASRVMVLLYTRHSNASQQVMREVERAVNKGVAIIPLRIEDEPLSKNMEYFISASHWLDALNGSLDRHLASLVRTIAAMLHEGPPGGPRPGGGRRPRARAAGALLPAAALVVAIGSGWMAMRRRAAAPVAATPAVPPALTAAPADTAPAGPEGPGDGPTPPDGARLFRQIQAAWVGAVYRHGADQERRGREAAFGRARTRPASLPAATQAAGPSFVTAPESPWLCPADDSGPKDVPAGSGRGRGDPTRYVVVVDYTHPNGRETLRHVYLGLRSPGVGQTIMYYNLEAPQQWAGEGFFLKEVAASKKEIPGGYRVTYSFRILPGWRPDGLINLEAWANDWDNQEGPHVWNMWQARYGTPPPAAATRP